MVERTNPKGHTPDRNNDNTENPRIVRIQMVRSPVYYDMKIVLNIPNPRFSAIFVKKSTIIAVFCAKFGPKTRLNL